MGKLERRAIFSNRVRFSGQYRQADTKVTLKPIGLHSRIDRYTIHTYPRWQFPKYTVETYGQTNNHPSFIINKDIDKRWGHADKQTRILVLLLIGI